MCVEFCNELEPISDILLINQDEDGAFALANTAEPPPPETPDDPLEPVSPFGPDNSINIISPFNVLETVPPKAEFSTIPFISNQYVSFTLKPFIMVFITNKFTGSALLSFLSTGCMLINDAVIPTSLVEPLVGAEPVPYII